MDRLAEELNDTLLLVNDTRANLTANATADATDPDGHLVGLILTGLLSVVLGLMILVTVIGNRSWSRLVWKTPRCDDLSKWFELN